MPAEAVGIHLVTCPADDPDSLLPDLALAFVHVPTAAKRKHFRKKKKTARRVVPPLLAACGIENLPEEHHAAVAVDATSIITPFQAAETIIFNHPDLLTARQDIAATVLYDHISQTLNEDSTLPLYISANGPGTKNPYTYNTVATDPSGNPIAPVDKDENGEPFLDKDGNALQWPQQNGQNVAPQTKLSVGVVGSEDGSQTGAAASALFAVLRSTKDDPSLNGQMWTVQHGITPVEQTNVPPTARLMEQSTAADPGFKWNLSNLTSEYGVQFYDETGATIGNPQYLRTIRSSSMLTRASPQSMAQRFWRKRSLTTRISAMLISPKRNCSVRTSAVVTCLARNSIKQT